MSNETLRAALAVLDHDNDDHWTDSGLPRIEAVKELAGLEETPTRAQIRGLAPDLVRGSPLETEEGPQEEPLEDAEADAAEAVREAEERLAQAQRGLAAVRAEQDKLIIAREGKRSRHSFGESVQAYLRSQAEVREESARRKQAFLDSGLSAADAAGGAAPIDAAMAARRRP